LIHAPSRLRYKRVLSVFLLSTEYL
jgi:hypothetical protein